MRPRWCVTAIGPLLCLLLVAAPPGALAVGEELVDALMSSDFVFDVDRGNAPMLPLAGLVVTDFGSARFAGECVSAAACRFETAQVAANAAAPVWVGERDLLVLGGAVTANTLEQAGRSRTVYSGSLLGAWVRQAGPRWQLAAFALPQLHVGGGTGDAETGQFIGGGVARRRHGPRLHSYYGLVWLGGEPEALLLPYVGLDWYLSPSWTLSLLAPWPSVSWAPSGDWFLRFGAAPAGASWRFADQSRERTADLARWKLGVSYERRLHRSLWGGVGAGATSLGRVRISDEDGVALDADFENDPYVELFLRFRPGP